MKSQTGLIVLSLVLGITVGYLISEWQNTAGIQVPVLKDNEYVETAFSPEQGATDLVVKTIKSAKKSIRVASYSFTSSEITTALISAHNEGIDVEIVADGSDRKGRGSKITTLKENKVPVRLNDQFSIMHNKFIIIDNNTVELGSFNYTSAAEHKNAENVLVLHNNPTIAQRYSKQWDSLWSGATVN